MSNDNSKKKTASERIQNLEDALLGTIKAVNGHANEQEVVKEALRLLSNKLDSVVQLLRAGQELSDLNISTVMVQNKANKLNQDVQAAVQTGLLSKSDSVDANSFVVCREVLDDGSVVNPRLQFTIANANETIRPKLLGAKILDKIVTEESKARLEVLEIYSVNEAPTGSPTPTDAASSSAPATPAAEEASAAPAQA